jgi:cytochrome c2
MADRGDTHYHIKHLNLWFAFSSLLLLATSVWMVLDDASRPWKEHQREFRALDLERTRASLENPTNKEQASRGEAMQADVAKATAAIDARQADIAAKQEVVRVAKGDYFVKETASKFAKAEYDWQRYLVDEHRLKHDDPAYGEAELAEVYATMQAAAFEKEQSARALAQAEAGLAQLKAPLTDAERALKTATKDVELARSKIEKLDPSAKPAQIANLIRDFPGLDFIGPNLKVQKVALDNLTFELNFTKKKRIDMCMSCHMGIEREGFEDAAQPYTTHPRLDLFLTAKSLHPLSKVGCTICHRGCGEALDFVRVDHRPLTDTQQEEWEKEYHWHKQHHWDYPMLPSGMAEAGCVQCHKDSMELIAPDAPKVSKGYQLFEEYGCYSCHKVEWFPTSRKPGPSLKNLMAKLTPEFVASWVAHPKAFRPTTRMPQIFNLENFADDEVVVKSKYGEGRDLNGREWNDAAVAAVTAFLQARHPVQKIPAMPLEGDALRGREAFRLSGCLGCHNTAPYGTEPAAITGDVTHERTGENEMGPNLRGVATKINADWLYAWVKDPARYWPDTRMPNLRLSDQTAADITAYMMEDPDRIFRDVPQGWKTELPPASLDVLQEQARWFFLRDGRATLEARFEGKDEKHRWDRLADLQVAVGEKYVTHQGCYSCHEVAGMETMMPIGAELTVWASKTVDKLDFGFMPEILAQTHDWNQHDVELYKSYHSNFLTQKLHAPRSYDRKKIKNPTEKLRMPYFGFSEEQVQAITTFVVGLVEDEVQRAKMVSNASQKARDAGLRAVRQNNCAACHVLEPGLVTFKDENGLTHTVGAEIGKLEGETLPPRMDRWAEAWADYDAYMKGADEEWDPEESVEISLRLLRPEPDFGDIGDTVLLKPSQIVSVQPPVGGDLVRVVTDWYMKPLVADESGEDFVSRTPDEDGGIGDVDGVFRKYSEEVYDKVRWTFAPPVLLGEGDKVQRDWFYAFLNDPITLRQQVRVKMPSFHYDAGEAGAIADYFAYEAERDWPAYYARKLRLAQKGSPLHSLDKLAAAIGVTPAALAGIENGGRAEIQANFAKVKAWGDAHGFDEVPGPVDPRYERVVRRSPAHVSALLAADPAHLARAEKLARDQSGPYCVQCHFVNGQGPGGGSALPIQWAPDLKNTHERLREDWVHKWIENPGKVYPGTSMPVNFPADKESHQALFPGPADVQIQALLDWLYNMGRQDLPAGN